MGWIDDLFDILFDALYDVTDSRRKTRLARPRRRFRANRNSNRARCPPTI